MPSFAAGVTFVVLFSLVTGTPFYPAQPQVVFNALPIGIHIGQALHAKRWWLFPTVVAGGVGETIGWVGRLWGSKEPTSMNPYLMQFVFSLHRSPTTNHRYIQNHDDNHQSYFHPRCQFCNTHSDHHETWAAIQSPETTYV